MKLQLAPAAAFVLLASSCVPGDPEVAEFDAAATEYVFIAEFQDAIYESAWYDINRKLDAEFDESCGDAFCEGEYTNLMFANAAVNCLDLSPAFDSPDEVRRALPDFE